MDDPPRRKPLDYAQPGAIEPEPETWEPLRHRLDRLITLVLIMIVVAALLAFWWLNRQAAP